ncbi:peptidoglycan/LPS O-acetylase OafA/YrhL [Chitinophaga terrae (ex Kim and Jung 2007)]|uniref:acyltransferase family protein n=1 Tax=Chitinophaga terrae (ex Kim and Jung 2007) TaxID=408074 RepID=UPI002785759B|nr:acyltransferase [Chitinophaga terrae (ex Kim and Jung 2007)]MDQ0108443.1 peptidoglycan/LPS O-acetylase OafA/YrhL [Chitinophaga terrae (ex Kim and Jung 2007)]
MITGTGAMTAPQVDPSLFKTKQHFQVLDGLRGVAALVVVVFHFMEVVYTDPVTNVLGHGFLAVDFFFCLSGFVIVYAYDNRMKQLGIAAFFKSRITRLHPLVVLGSALGLAGFLFDPFSAGIGDYSAGRIALLFLASVLMIPFPVMADRYYNLFGLNAPSWSLFWEYVANLLYGLLLWKANRRVLAGLLLAATGAIAFVAYTKGNVVGGWSKESFWDGAARVSFSFLAGMLLFRYNIIIKNKLGFAGLAVLLLAALLMPYFKYNWLAELLVVVIYFPLLVALGAGTQVSGVMEKICSFSGKLSYPLYMTHYMVIWSFANYYNKYKPGGAELSVIITGGVIVLVIFAYLAMVLYDTPVRRYLSRKRNPG